MARRKDHSPQELRERILRAAEKIIHAKGLKNLTARALASAIGYAPGTIYNFYRDMDAVVTDINYATLGRLEDRCRQQMGASLPGLPRVKSLAYAYIDFAHDNRRAWETIFTSARKAQLPKHYRQRLSDLFALIEKALQEELGMQAAEAAKTARLMWACMHGIAMLTLDGRIDLVGVEPPHDMIDTLLDKYLTTCK